MNTTEIKLLGVAPLILVYDVQASVDFYCQKVGFTLVTHAPDFTWVLLRLNGVDLMMEPKYAKGQTPDVAHHRDFVLYFGCSNVDEAYQRLRAHGVECNEPRIASYGMKQLYFSDPDGHLLCFQFPATDEWFDAWQKWYGKDFRKT